MESERKRGSLQLSAAEMGTIFEEGKIPLDKRRVIEKKVNAALDEIERWRNLPALDRKAYHELLHDAAKHLRLAASSLKSAQPLLREALNRTVRRLFIRYLPAALIQELDPPTKRYRPSPCDLESRDWQEGDYEAWSYGWRYDYLGEHGARAIAILLDRLALRFAFQRARELRDGAPGHPERNHLIAHLIALWEQDLGRKATGTKGGAFLKFVNAVCLPLDWGPNQETRVQRVLADYRRQNPVPSS